MELCRRRFIIIADDNKDLCMGLSLLLKLAGFAVEIVHNGNDAVTAARTRCPDVLLLDVGLPDLDGYQVAEQFRGDDGLKHVLIMAMSGYSTDMFPGRSNKAHFDHYLVKPVDFSILLPLIHNAG
jgi:DNA-binding response OmpR family regulator